MSANIQILTACEDELRGVSAVLFSWIDLQFEVLPFPSPEPKWEAVLRLAGAAQ